MTYEKLFTDLFGRKTYSSNKILKKTLLFANFLRNIDNNKYNTFYNWIEFARYIDKKYNMYEL